MLGLVRQALDIPQKTFRNDSSSFVSIDMACSLKTNRPGNLRGRLPTPLAC
jgi:hypothetical protein